MLLKTTAPASALAVAIALLCTLAAPADGADDAGSDAAPRPKPNLLFILADDLGWMDLACQGNPHLHTPHLDRLAADGMRFTDAYAAAPVCSPTRAAVLTGLSPARLRITNHLPDQERFIPDGSPLLPAECRDHLALEATTIAERLREDAGYATAFIGKWHLYSRDEDRQFAAGAQGFDTNIGGCSLGGPPTFFDPYRIDFLENREPGEYLTDRLADETVRFMREQHEAGNPFYVALFPYAVHWPMEAPDHLVAKYRGRPLEGYNHEVYPAMIEALDAAVGRILGELDGLGIADETLVVFTSDNGPFGGVGDARPLRADKGHLYEGGVRVPLIARWPGQIAAGSVCREPVILTDFYATLLDAAGLEPEPGYPGDGASLLSLLRGEGRPERDALFWHYPNFAFHRDNRLGGAVRAGDFKLIEFFDGSPPELYNLRDDIGEQHNLATEMPERTAELLARLQAWRESSGAAMPKPRG